jgi:hypothetical protein
MPFTLEELLPDDQVLRTVQLHESVQHVINVMHQHSYNQVPVVDTDGKTSLDQVVTFDAILQAAQSFNTKPELLQVRDVARTVRTYAPDADLLATLDDIQRDNFALIVDEANVLTGIVTTADTTVFFREYAQDLMQIEGIESRMKEAIRALYSGNDAALEAAIESVTDRAADIRRKLPAAIRAYMTKAGLTARATGTDVEAISEAEKRLSLPKPGKEFEHLSFDEFTQVLLSHQNAPKLSQTKDVTELRVLLQQVRDARNKLAHFRGELTSEERRTIQFASEWLERNLPAPPAILPAVSGPTATVVSSAVHQAPEEEDERPHGSYAPLATHLEVQPLEKNTLTLSFHEIERILGKELPRSAYEYRAWWSNDPTKPQSAAWLEEGWRTTSLSMTDRRLTFVRTSDREESYISFFSKLNARLADEADFPSRQTSPSGTNWMILASLEWIRPEAANINASFTRRKELRIELYLDCGEKDTNKKRFDELHARKVAIEIIVGEPLQWERMENRRACRIAAYTKAQAITDAESPALVEWAAKKGVDFYRAFLPEFPDGTES